MNKKEVINNEVVEAAEEIVENSGLSKGVKILVGVGLGIFAVTVVYNVSVVAVSAAYKYVANPIITKVRTKLKQKKASGEDETIVMEQPEIMSLKDLEGKLF